MRVLTAEDDSISRPTSFFLRPKLKKEDYDQEVFNSVFQYVILETRSNIKQ